MAAKIVATTVADKVEYKAIGKAQYLCCFNSYVDDYEKEKSKLSAQRKRLQKNIEEAKKRNEIQIEDEVQQWLYETDKLIQEDTKTKKKWLWGLFTNCSWQYAQGKELAKKTQDIQMLIESGNFDQLALPINNSSLDFIHFESRMPVFEKLKEALKDDENYMIGLEGNGGTGKTTMAKAVGKAVEESKLFDKVIFIVVSHSPDVKKIQAGIARQLGLRLEEGKQSAEHANTLCSRIANGGEKILIILDNVWLNLNLLGIGIPLGHHHESGCSVLLTTHYRRVCSGMGCQMVFSLELLTKMEAWNLFQLYAGLSADYSNIFEEVALHIVEECRGLPIAVVAVAKALSSKPLEDWKAALIRLQMPQYGEYEDLPFVYNSLVLGYDYLKNEKVKAVFLLCSLFPEDFEIPIELLCRIAIGLGLCGGVDKYYTARSQMLEIKNQLIDSCLLLKAEEECVKMNDLVRDVALQIGKEEIRVIMNSRRIILKKNIRYSSWNIDGFPSYFDGGELEILLVWVNANRYVEVPDSLFEGMKRLRVLLLICTNEYLPVPAPSLLQSIHSLGNIRTLLLTSWELGDISVLGSLQRLETLELNNCSITELPTKVITLVELRLLGLRYCKIKRNNPFKVIEGCPQLEELYYVENSDILYRGNEDKARPQIRIPPASISHHAIRIPPALKRYHIIGSQFPNSLELNASSSKCFKPSYLKEIFSAATIKLLAAKAEILELGGYHETGWTNLVPDIVSIEEGGMEDLIRLHLYDWSEMECLIHTEHLFQFDVPIFSKLVELKLFRMDVKELCRGPLPVGFLEQLEQLDLKECLKLESSLFKGLRKLKSIKLEDCSMTSLFNQSTAQSLDQLETLIIHACYQLKYIIMNEGSRKEIVNDHYPDRMSYGSIFPKLKFLHVESCDKLEFILPICCVEDLPLLEGLRIVACEEVKYIFGQYPDEADLYQKEIEIILQSLKEMQISEVPNFISIFPEYHHPSSIMQNSSPTTGDGLREKDHSPTFFWTRLCCFLSKSSAKNAENPSVSKATLLERIGSQILKKEWIFNTTRCLLSPPLCPQNMRKIKITHCSEFTSLFTLSIASSMSLLAKLEVGECRELKHIFTDDGDDDDHKKYGSIFPKLQEVFVWNCDLLESLFPAAHFRTLDHLKSLRISGTPKLRYVLGKCDCDDNLPHHNQSVETHIDQPAQENTSLEKSKQEAADEVDEEDLAIQEQNNNFSNLTEIKEREEPSAREDLKLEKATIANEMMYSEELSKASPAPLFIPLQNESPQNTEASVGEGPSEKYIKPTSSTHSEPKISKPNPLTSTKESMGNQEALKESKSTKEATRGVDKPLDNTQEVKEPTNACSSKEGSNKTALAIRPTFVEMKDSAFNPVATSEDISPLISSISASKNPQIVTLATQTEPGSLQPDPLDVSANLVSQQVAKAFADLEASLKMGLLEIASSEENNLRLQNALSFLSTHYCEDGSPLHDLKPTIESLHQEIPSIISSFKQISARLATIDTFSKLEEKGKRINENLPQ